MGQYDAHDNIKIKEVIPIQTVGTTGTGRTGAVIDRAGYAGVEFLLGFGAVTATNAAFTVTVKEGDVTGTMSTVTAANLLGSTANGTVGQAATRTSGVSKNVTKRIGYKGLKRYVSANVSSTISSGANIHVQALLTNPANAPVAT
jgi:hypothetical protein